MTTTDGRLVGLPKNQTGLFAGDDVELFPAPITTPRDPLILSSRPRPFLPPAVNNSLKNLTKSSTHGRSANRTLGLFLADPLPNAFPPSNIRRQKSRMIALNTQREINGLSLPRDLPSKQSMYSSPASARLKSEIEHIQSKLKAHADLYKSLMLAERQEGNETTSSALSNYASGRVSSASTIHTHSRMNPRQPSAVTNATINTCTSVPSLIDASLPSSVTTNNYQTPPMQPEEVNLRPTHAYRVPQLSNVGSESMFTANETSAPSAGRNLRRSSTKKPATVVYPFYVMYLSGLTNNQQLRRRNENRSDSESTTTSSTHRKIFRNSRSDSSSQRGTVTPITTYEQQKRFSARMTAFENENSSLLKDLLRTTSWNHLQV